MPQGSILGPILFIMYVSDMHIVSSLMKSIIFADDTNFLYTGNDISEISKTVSKELDKLSSWLMANKLSLNVSKTNFMLISRKQIVNNPIVSINSINIERVYIKKILDVHIDCKLDWNKIRDKIILFQAHWPIVYKTKIHKNTVHKIEYCTDRRVPH